MENNIIELSPVIEINKKIKQLKTLGRTIAMNFPEERFEDNPGPTKYNQLYIYIRARSYESNREDSYKRLDNHIEDAKFALKALVRGENIKHK
tara:strand:+ start:3658 stop:3936 length:279 start_codon:yes stop_codon:yes gene_type:complete